MLKLLILVGIFYLLFRALKKWVVFEALSARKGAFPKSSDQIDDLMVKDPYCDAYFPKREGYPLRWEGEELHFCSKECRDNYLTKHGKSTS
jgi:YHS domain-containing protein